MERALGTASDDALLVVASAVAAGVPVADVLHDAVGRNPVDGETAADVEQVVVGEPVAADAVVVELHGHGLHVHRSRSPGAAENRFAH